jgi:16S rRNA (guanine966-N2)-methyltransferase
MSSAPRRQATASTKRPAGAPGQLRIIGGQWRRLHLPVPDAPGLRPTPDRVRETLFNWLGQDLDGWRVLDAFAGSGALGFEAASRGASDVMLIERDARLARALEQSRQRLDAKGVRVLTTDAIGWMSRATRAGFELVLLDPPFADGLFDAALAAAAPLVAEGGWLYLEADRAFDAAGFEPLGFTLHRHLRAGAVHAHLLRRAAAAYTSPDAARSEESAP